jgi:hypothetical protein
MEAFSASHPHIDGKPLETAWPKPRQSRRASRWQLI